MLDADFRNGIAWERTLRPGGHAPARLGGPAVVLLLCLVAASGARAQSDVPLTGRWLDGVVAGEAAPKDSSAIGPVVEPPRGSGEGLSTRQVRFRTHALMWGGVAAVGLYGATTWWKAGVDGRFRTVDEGWFGQDTYAGGADKFGHLYSAYVGTRLLTLGYQWAGNDHRRSVKLAVATTLGTLMAVELMDGFSREYRFSLQDSLMNALGTGMGLLMEHNPGLDKLLAFRLLYRPSDGASFDPVDNYSGQTYLLVLKAGGVPALRRYPVLRYLELAVGYGSRGYESTDPALHSRHLYFGLALNLSRVLNDTVFSGRRQGSTAQHATGTFLKYVQLPGTAALADHELPR